MFKPAGPNSYPTAADLLERFTAPGMMNSPPSPQMLLYDLPAAVATGIAEWERMVNWFPFYSGGSGAADTARTLYPTQDGSGGFGGGFLSTGFVNEFAFGMGGYAGGGYDIPLQGGLMSCTSVVAGSTTYTIGGATPQVRLLPDNALVRSRPYDTLRFLAPVGYSPGGIVVTGRWGFCDSVPADVWNAVLDIASLVIAPLLVFGLTGGLDSYTDADVTEKFRASPFGESITQWQTRPQAVANQGHYRLGGIG